MRAIDLHYKEEYSLYILVLLLGLIYCYISFPFEKQPTFLFYSGTLVSSMACIYVSENTERKYIKHFFFWLGMAIIGYPMAFRLADGMDVLKYRQIFENAQYFSKVTSYFRTSGQERGYLFLNWWFCRFVSKDYNHFQVFIVYLTHIFWGIAFRKNSNMKGSGMFMVLFLWSHLYFFTLSAGLLRIFMALSITFIALQYLWKDQWKWFLIWLILAAFIHLSCLVMLLFLVFFYKKDWFYKHWLLFVVISFFVVLVALFTMARFLIPIMGDKYEGYGNVSNINFSLGCFTTLPIWLLCYIYYKNLPTTSIDYKKKYIIGMILISLSIIFSIASTAVHVGRIIYYAYLGLLIVVSAIFQIRTRHYSDILLKCLLIIYSLVYVMVTTLTNYRITRLFPYESFLSE
ncbi:MAG: EpsG family protein [Prevotella sp.]|nr:EpsG family protein [Prevotella sp.]